MIQQHVKKLSTLLHNSNWPHDFILATVRTQHMPTFFRFNANLDLVICQRRKQIPVVAYCTIYRLLGGKGRGEESATIIRGSFFKVGHLNERDTKKPP